MRISLYSMRHQYVYWRLKVRKVKTFTLAANIGSSVQRIEQNYGHIKPVEYAEELLQIKIMMVELKNQMKLYQS